MEKALKLKPKTPLFILLIALFFSACAKKKEAAAPPNIVLIMTDDQGWGDIQMHGNDSVQTPVLDQFAKESVTFDRFYVSPVCAPTRASLLTGRYHLRTGCTWVTHRKEVMRSEEITLAEELKKAGYVTGIFGKWHNGEQYPHNPLGQGFDEFLGFCAGHWNNYFNTTLWHNGQTVKTEGYITDILTDKALEFINRQKDQPFFCYIPYNAPHSPMQVPDMYFEKYKRKGISDFNAAAYGMVENIDFNVGRILKHLDDLNLSDNTIVLFTTDNGPNGNRYNGGMKGRKGWVDEGGVRVPLFIRWENGNLVHGKTIEPIAMHIDLMPTLLDLCGIEKSKDIQWDGRSLLDLLKGKSENWPERMLFTFPTSQNLKPHPGAVRTPQHRLVLERSGEISLYDMKEDPSQKDNIAQEFPGITDKLHQAYLTAFEEVTKSGNTPPPIEIGHSESPQVVLPAPESKLYGGLKFKGGMGWANDWITTWKSEEDHASWKIEVVERGDFEVGIQYTCKPEDIGTTIIVEAGEKTIETIINEAHDPEYLPSPDRKKRIEVYEKQWKQLLVGTLSLMPGTYELKVKARQIKGQEVIELKAVVINKN